MDRRDRRAGRAGGATQHAVGGEGVHTETRVTCRATARQLQREQTMPLSVSLSLCEHVVKGSLNYGLKEPAKFRYPATTSSQQLNVQVRVVLGGRVLACAFI